MSEEQQDIQVDESKIQELVEQRAKEIAAEQFKGYQSPDEVQGLINKRDELLEKVSKFKGITPEEVERIRQDNLRREKDEVYALISDGKHDEAMDKMFGAQKTAMQEKISSTEEQLLSAQKMIEQLEAEKGEILAASVDQQKRAYLKDLTGEDESFRSTYFSEFYALYKDQLEIDSETGAVYALQGGKRLVDEKGNHIKFDVAYGKAKAENGLFWRGAQGTNSRGGKGGGSDKPFAKMTNAEKTELRGRIGEEEFRKLVLSAGKK